MKIGEHLLKWRRFEAARVRLDAVDDFELWFWAMLSGGTALVNAALHAAGITQENDLLATQIPHVYSVWGDAQKIASDCDLIHVDVPRLDSPLPPDLERAFAAMRVFETLRDPCIRSGKPATSEVVALCAGSYADLVEALGPRLQVHGL